MKNLGITISIILWMIITCFMVITVVGMISFVVTNNKTGNSCWFEIIENLIKKY